MTEDLHPGPANTPLDDQERLFPRPEPGPAGTVVEIGDDSISAGERPDRVEDPVARRDKRGRTSRQWSSPRSGCAARAGSAPGSRLTARLHAIVPVAGSSRSSPAFQNSIVQRSWAKPVHQPIEEPVRHVFQDGQADSACPRERRNCAAGDRWREADGGPRLRARSS